MNKKLNNLIKYAEEAWATLDHDQDEILVGRLWTAIKAIKVTGINIGYKEAGKLASEELEYEETKHDIANEKISRKDLWKSAFICGVIAGSGKS